ncbi:MAG TPA: gliding motility-associated C-terminal domain-containing protein [Bacteroidia bacterium]
MQRLYLLIILVIVSLRGLSQRDSYACLDNQGIYKLDVLQCDTQFVGYTGINLTDIALTTSRNLYGIDFYTLYKIDTLNAALTYVANIDVGGGGFNSLIALNDDYLLAIYTNSEIYKINTQNGIKSLVGTCGYIPAGDLTFYKGCFFMADINNSLIKIKLSDNYTSVISVENIGQMNTETHTIYGILTVGNASCEEDNLKLFAFEDWRIYIVDPNNASCTLYCDSIYPGGAMGATSLAEIQFQGHEGLLDIPNIFTPNDDGINDFITSPKMYGILEINIEIFDRWGMNVFSDSNNELKWDGKTKSSSLCNAGVYFYIISYINYCNKELTSKGFIQLIR